MDNFLDSLFLFLLYIALRLEMDNNFTDRCL